MNKNLTIKILSCILTIALIWGLIWAYSISRLVKKNSKNASLKSQQAIVKNIIVTETKNEKKYWEFYAKSGSYVSENNKIQLNDVIGNFYDKEGQVVVSFKSDKGEYDELSKKVVLTGDNLFVGKDGSRLHADELIWQGQDMDILANGNVQFIQENKLVTKSNKAVFNSTLTNFKIMDKAKVKIYADDKTKKKYTKL